MLFLRAPATCSQRSSFHFEGKLSPLQVYVAQIQNSSKSSWTAFVYTSVTFIQTRTAAMWYWAVEEYTSFPSDSWLPRGDWPVCRPNGLQQHFPSVPVVARWSLGLCDWSHCHHESKLVIGHVSAKPQYFTRVKSMWKMGISVCWSFKLELTVTNICRNALLSQPLKDQHVCLCAANNLRVSLLHIEKQIKAILAALMATVAKSLISVCKHLNSVSASPAATQLLCFHAVCIMESDSHHLD